MFKMKVFNPDIRNQRLNLGKVSDPLQEEYSKVNQDTKCHIAKLWAFEMLTILDSHS